MLHRFAVGEIPTTYTGGIPADVLELHGKYTRYRSTHWDGFGRPKADVFLSEAATGNFSTFSGSKVSQRELSFDIDIMGERGFGLELLREAMPFNAMRRFYITTPAGKTVYIDGIAEEITDDWDNGKNRTCEVEILCPFPWFTSVQRHTAILNSMPTLLRTDGDIDAGLELYLSGSVSELTLASTEQTITVSGTHTFSEEYPALCTVEGNRVTYDAAGTPLWASLTTTSEWIVIDSHNGTELTLNGAEGTAYWHDYYSGVSL